MALMRAFAKVDEESRIRIAKNIARETGLKPGAAVEIKVGGPARAQFVTLRPRKKGQLR